MHSTPSNTDEFVIAEEFCRMETDVMTPVARALLLYLLLPIRFPSTGAMDLAAVPAAESTERNQMAKDAERCGTDKAKHDPCTTPDMVNTPAGPVPKEQVHEVKPGETVRRNEDGTFTTVPRAK
jgi:hypothetical protein